MGLSGKTGTIAASGICNKIIRSTKILALATPSTAAAGFTVLQQQQQLNQLKKVN